MTAGNFKKWKPCYADWRRGVAFFDGITIETDPFSSPRYDRVIPILEEEQIFMCRQMDHDRNELGIKKGTLVLDIGTGSGVLAIWAAKQKCKVVAIDCSERAIMFAKANAERNSIKESRQSNPDNFNFDAIENGEIHFITAKFDNDFLSANESCFSNKFDLIFLTPPYNPTFPYIVPPIHAYAGELGQDIFNNYVPLLPIILKDNGHCIINQLTLYNTKDKTVHALKTIEDNFNNNCSIRYLHILKDDCKDEDAGKGKGAKAFLEGIYENYLNPDIYNNNKQVKDYIDNIGALDDLSFILLYIDVCKNPPNCIIEQIKHSRIYPPDKCNWDHRIRLHRYCVENVSPLSAPISIPFTSLIIEQPGILESPFDSESETDPMWRDSMLRNFAKWVKTCKFLGSDNEGIFDILLIDTAPYWHIKGAKIKDPKKLIEEW